MDNPRLVQLTEKLNKYVALIKSENPNISDKELIDRASTMALTEQKTFEAKAGMDKGKMIFVKIS